MHQTLINSFPARYFDVLSSVTVEESSNDMLLGPIWRIPMDRKSAPTLVIPQGILAKQCRMLLFQIYHLSGYAGGRDIVKNAAVACIRRGGARSACLDSALVAYLSSVSPLPSEADAPFTLDQFLAEAPWSAVQFLMAHEAGHLVQRADKKANTLDVELEADLLGLQSVVSNGVLPIGLLASHATISLIDEVVPPGAHGTAACRAARSLQLTKRLLPKILLLNVALYEPKAFARAQQQRQDLSDTMSLAMSPAQECATYDPARFDALERDFDTLVALAKTYVETASVPAAVGALTSQLAATKLATGDGAKWKTIMLVMLAMKAGAPLASGEDQQRELYANIDRLLDKSDLSGLAPVDYAALHYFRALIGYVTRPAGTGAVANARTLIESYDAVGRYFPLEGRAFEFSMGRMKGLDGSGVPGLRVNLDAFGILMFKISYDMARVVAFGCDDAANLMKELAELNPAAKQDLKAACLDLRRSTIESQQKKFGWTVD